MTIEAAPRVVDGNLMVRGKVVLAGVPANVVVSPVSSGSVFLGATSLISSSRHVFSLGVLEKYKLLCLFRFKIWWMIPRVGNSGSEIPMETQLLLLEAREGAALQTDTLSSDPTNENIFYILLLPVLEGQFRATLQGSSSNELQFVLESGDVNAQTLESREAVFMNSGDNPYELIKESIKILEKQKGTFSHIDNKKLPSHLNWFGWCTWDAFYKGVDPKGIKEGLQSFADEGCSPKFLIIDDGWQETLNEFKIDGEPFVLEKEFADRLVDIKENSKFKSPGSEDICTDLRDLVHQIKEKYGLKYVYMWHALIGYWGGILPSSEAMKKYNPKVVYPIQSPGNVGNLRDIAMDSLEKYGVGIIDPEKIYTFYNDLHGYLASCGVDGVKVDVQNVVETISSGSGGTVSLPKHYQESLEQSVLNNFKENNWICCMSHSTDLIYSSKQSAVARASEDFMPRDRAFQTVHVASVAFNSLLLGEIVVPDWDMFHSKHEAAEFHGAARAIGGCAVYVSDKPGNHDLQVIKKLVLPDGSILRARHAGRPTRDCLFKDPVMDGKSLLKIWNLNKLAGVVGVFNCQGVGNWPMKHADQNLQCANAIVLGHVSPLDVEFLEQIAGNNWMGYCAVYTFNSGSLVKLSMKEKLEVSLATFQWEICTISPIRVLPFGIHFAPLGLLDMYNSGGAVDAIDYIGDISGCILKLKSRGYGRFGAFSSIRPKRSTVDTKEVDFTYNDEDGLLIVKLEGEGSVRDIHLVY